MTEVQGIDMRTFVREIGDTDWSELVCEIDSQFQLTNETTEVDTKCGTVSGIKVAKGNISGNAMFNMVPDANQVSWQDVANWQINKTRLEMLQRNEEYVADDGSTIAEGTLHIFNTGRFVDSTLQAPNGDVGKFSWTFKPNGVPTLSGASA